MKTTTSKWFTGGIGALVVLGIVIAVNLLFSGVRLRKDLTEEKQYTLSEGTATMLQELQRPVTLKFYVSKSNPNLPMPLKNYVQRVIDFMRELADRSGGNVIFETWDPQPDSDAEEWAQRYGLMPQATGGIGAVPDLYLGLVAVAGTREAAIPFLDPSAEPQLEYLVVRMIHEVTRSGSAKLGVLSTLPVLGAAANPFMQQASGEDWLFVSELKKQYAVQPVMPEAESIPEDLDALILVHPHGLSERTLFAIDQFLLKGGRLIAYVDPMCISTERNLQAGEMPQPSSDINRLSSAWGITMDAQTIVADVAAATPINLGDGRAERLPAWLTLRGKDNLDRQEIVTAPLDNVMLPFAGAFVGEPVEGLTMTALAQASPDAVMISAYQARNPAMMSTRGGAPAPDARLAVRLSGSFPTAFPDGPPVAEGETNEPPATVDNWLKVSEKESSVVLISDADLLSNDFSARGMNIFGQILYQPFNDNLNFTLNLLEQMTGNPALIGLRSRGRFDRPFERVLALERTAQERWQEQEELLQQKLMDTQRRINDLQALKEQDQQLVLSVAQKAEIEKFRQERFEIQRQLKDVRKNLRRSIESLGLRLKVLNMAAVPALVAIFGIVYGWRRRTRAAG